MNAIGGVMMKLIKSEINGTPFDKTICRDMADGEWDALYRLARRHDLTHLVGDGIIRNQLLPDGTRKTAFENSIFAAIYRYERMKEGLDTLEHLLRTAGITFVSLKGAVIRAAYPKPWLRTSCDIDILVHKEDLLRAVELCRGEFSFEKTVQSSHNISFTANSGVHIELHHDLMEAGIMEKASVPLRSVWEYTDPVPDSPERKLRDDLFFYYHIAHMAKHLLSGGSCGARSFLDLWLLNRNVAPEAEAARRKLLAAGGLDRFADAADDLATYWFGDGTATPTQITVSLEAAVLSGGNFGTMDAAAAAQRARTKNIFGFVLQRLWMPYSQLVGEYPGLKGRRILQPFYEFHRWLRLGNASVFHRSARELRTGIKAKPQAVASTAELLDSLGLLHENRQ